MRSTWPIDEMIEHQIADDEDRCGRASAAAARAAQTAADMGGGARLGPVGGVRQRHQHQEQHQELGVAEIVFEQPGGEHRRNRRQAAVRQRSIFAGPALRESP